MIYAGILAGGKGERMQSSIPKQFLPACGKPVLYYSLRQFRSIDQIGKIIVSCHQQYMGAAREIADGLPPGAPVEIIAGGRTRHQSFVNIIECIKRTGFAAGDKILLHEAARPLVDAGLIREHIRSLDLFEATNTLFGATDTMMVSSDGEFIEQVPPKKNIFHGQGPQGYDLATLARVLESEVSEGDLSSELDLCAIYIKNRRSVRIVAGNERLFKLTYPTDFALLEHYLRKDN